MTYQERSKIRVLVNKPYHRSWHDTQQAKDGFCTVTGTPPQHRATRSLYVRDSAGEQWWIAACDEHVPPDAEEDHELGPDDYPQGRL
jgi:hypothetical protein